ncbi:MAG: 3-oxoacyl-ACP reductase [Baekduia sp.]
MSADRYQQLTTTPPGRFLQSRLGLPEATPLRRYEPGAPLLDGSAVVLGAGRVAKPAADAIAAAGVTVATELPAGQGRVGAVVLDATAINTIAGLRELYDELNPAIVRLAACGRLVVLGTPPELTGGRSERIAQRALEGFVRSAAKELRKGATAQLVYVAPGAEGSIASTLEFLLSGRSAYVDGQKIVIGEGVATATGDRAKPLAGLTAVVTGASRGIGEAMARTLARDGATVVCVDIQAQGDDLATVANSIEGSALALDVTAADAGNALAEYVKDRHGTLDILVLNAGITRDKTLARMKPEAWDAVIEVNLASQERMLDQLLKKKALGKGARVVTVSSIAGIAGNRGQTNYGTSKAGVIGLVDAYAPELAAVGATINAVAPGFIETQMTAAVPLMIREAGRRMNSLAQGGQPIDVAETVAWFAQPASGAVNGNVVRVCGQSLLGA